MIEETLCKTNGHWPARLVHETWPRWLTCWPCQCPPPPVRSVCWMAPFKCMAAPLTASMKKIKGDFFSLRSSQSNISTAAQRRKRRRRKLQGVSFILGVQKRCKMRVAVSACLLPPPCDWAVTASPGVVGVSGNVDRLSAVTLAAAIRRDAEAHC